MEKHEFSAHSRRPWQCRHCGDSEDGHREKPVTVSGRTVVIAVPLPEQFSMAPNRWMVVCNDFSEYQWKYMVTETSPDPDGVWRNAQGYYDLTLTQALEKCVVKAREKGAR
ncbi:hypothetical protein [Longispora urticae]